ncbi:unnamed protein product [Toxocara canis]|uniref:Cytochrome b5 heme-binding domain-containing protein n=1 Tax=Toxocara canis TaxID=6265 RepID=A0A183TZ48_TOXCA|nr:unnamed protein product [Toxocara canis]
MNVSGDGVDNAAKEGSSTRDVTQPSENTSLSVPQVSMNSEADGSEHLNAKIEIMMLIKVPRSGRSKGGRLKVALQPGRGIMDWVKLTSGRHIASKQLPFVGDAELKRHTTVDDCWVLLEDKVYDVTEYLSFHPGGVDELMRAAGCDGTRLFNKYHAWINQDTMLKACFVGYFRGDRNKLSKPKSSWSPVEGECIEECDCESGEEGAAVDELFTKLNIRITEVSEGNVHLTCEKWADLKSENVCVDVIGNCVRVLIRPFGKSRPLALTWSGIPKLLTSSPFTVSVESSTIKVHFEHSEDMAIFSSVDLISVEEDPGRFIYFFQLLYRPCTIKEMRQATRNIYLYRMNMSHNTCFALPVGHHVNLKINKNGFAFVIRCITMVEFIRPYTPVLLEESGRTISFLIKVYEDGKFSCALRRLKPGWCNFKRSFCL